MKTKLIKTKLDGVYLIEIDYFKDERGFFIEVYNQRTFDELGLSVRFVQDNHSRSAKNVLRGLHYQDMSAPMAKLIRCTLGEILDVAVDLRVGSPTFGQWVSQILSSENMLQLYCPVGFAHGFLTLSDFAEVQYKCTNFYTPSSEGVIKWNDPDINIEWNIKDPITSKRDSQGMSLKEYLTKPAFVYK